jgi:alpha-ribazole phosphatase
VRKKLFLIRHAEVDPSFRGRYLGSTDTPLSQTGITQSIRLGSSLAGWFGEPQVWISPLVRCQQTWKNLEILPRTNKVDLPELREIDFGQWEGKTFNEIHSLDPQAVECWGQFDPKFTFPEGESLASFVARMNLLKDKICSAFNRPSQDGQASGKANACNEILLITHGGVIATLICLFLGIDPSQYLLFRIARPSISELTVFENGKGVLEKLNFGLFERRHGEWPG